MKKYRVTVNGTVYEVELEELTGAAPAASASAAAPAAPAAAPAAPAASAEGTPITAPMPGTILSVNVSNGQAVKRGRIRAEPHGVEHHVGGIDPLQQLLIGDAGTRVIGHRV